MSEAPSCQNFAQQLVEHVGQVLRGKRNELQHCVTTLLAGGHLLIEDKPGVGKTLLARALARALALPFQRVQCTADLLPTDVIGAQVYHPQSGELSFRPGPVFTSILLADELNRTPPRTQSALLECMAERNVTIERTTHELPDPFFVIATQNPLAFAGTYPLPESQLDRFLMRLELGYPEPESERDIVMQEDGHRLVDQLEALGQEDALRNTFVQARAAVDAVHMSVELVDYIVALAQRTRVSPDVELGISTRGAQALHRACRARAVTEGRDFVVPDDVQRLLLPVCSHRLVAPAGANEAVLQELLESVPSPD